MGFSSMGFSNMGFNEVKTHSEGVMDPFALPGSKKTSKPDFSQKTFPLCFRAWRARYEVDEGQSWATQCEK